ncbi:hypothetical protein [Pseudomonas sp. 44 R 15]|nr:hypothetical protein [Pseudomonas sp. 44 R 15]
MIKLQMANCQRALVAIADNGVNEHLYCDPSEQTVWGNTVCPHSTSAKPQTYA